MSAKRVNQRARSANAAVSNTQMLKAAVRAHEAAEGQKLVGCRPPTHILSERFQNALLLGLLQCRKLRRAAQPQNHYRCQHRKALRAKLRAREAAGRNAQSSRTTISFKPERAAKIGRRAPAPTPVARVSATEEARTCARRVAPAWWQS